MSSDPAPRRSLYPVVRLVAALLLMTVGASGMFVVVVALKPVAQEFGALRGAASLPYTLTMLGFGLGGILMGRASDRFGMMPPAIVAALGTSLGYVLASRATSLLEFCLAQGLLIGLLGASATFAPLVADISHWFGRRRGVAVAIVISGSYLAGTVWPPIVQHWFDAVGWRATYLGLGAFCLATMLPLALVLAPRPAHATTARARATTAPARPLRMSPAALQWLLCAAGVGCCMAMATPQVHIVAYATDLGYPAQRGAEMLSLMLGFGVVSRLVSGWVSDRIGGLRTLVLGSALQALMIAAFLPFRGLGALYLLSALFGLSQGGIVPSYAIIVRTYFPPGEAGWRIGAAMMATTFGMAMGGWFAGALYDLTGSYQAAFAAGVGFNLFNLAIALFLLHRARGEPTAVVHAAA